MYRLINLNTGLKHLYSVEFMQKHYEHLIRCEAWHAECNKRKSVDTTKVSRPKTRKVSIQGA